MISPQGTVFDLVIQEVCDSSQVDFEESGVDQQTLLDLRQVCFFFRLFIEYFIVVRRRF